MLLTAIAVHAARTSSTVFDNLIAGWSADVAPFQSFFQHEHFGKAWKQIRADLKKQLKRKPAAVELIFLGSGIRPIAELLTVHRVSELTKLDIHVRFYDVQFESEVDPRLDRETRQLLGGVGLQEAVPSVATVELRREHRSLADLLRRTRQDAENWATLVIGFNALNQRLPSDAKMWEALVTHRGEGLIYHDHMSWEAPRTGSEHYGWTLRNKLDHYVESYERKAREQLDAQLWRGSIDGAVGMVQAQATDQMVSDGAALPTAQAAVSVRLLLRTTTLLEGWAQMLLQEIPVAGTPASRAAAAGEVGARAAAAAKEEKAALFARCDVDAGPLLRAGDGVRRDDVVSAIGRCARNLNIWAQLGPEGERNHGQSNAHGWTPLHLAAAFGSREVVEDLLALGASATARTASGLTPLHVAIAHLRPAAVPPLAAAAGVDRRSTKLDAASKRAAEAASAASAEEGYSIRYCAAMLRELDVTPKDSRARCFEAAHALADHERDYDDGTLPPPATKSEL